MAEPQKGATIPTNDERTRTRAKVLGAAELLIKATYAVFLASLLLDFSSGLFFSRINVSYYAENVYFSTPVPWGAVLVLMLVRGRPLIEGGSKLAWLWWVLNPLVAMATYSGASLVS